MCAKSDPYWKESLIGLIPSLSQIRGENGFFFVNIWGAGFMSVSFTHFLS